MDTMPVEKYYSSMEGLLKKHASVSRKLGYAAASIPEYEAWKKELREKLAELSGIVRMDGCSLSPRILEKEKMDGYERIKLLIQTEPEVWMTFYMLVPDSIPEKGKRPCVIAPHGHGSAGKDAVAGKTETPGVQKAIDKYNYDYGVQLVRQGYIVFCPDARGFGERREYWMQGNGEEKILGSSCTHLNNAAISMGFSLTGFCTWDLMRLMDYIETNPLCDSDKIACCGFSGGGLQTLWLTAMDDRVRCAVISGYFYGFREALLLEPHCSCNYIPHLWEYADAGDLGALIAPRPLLIESGTNDRLNGQRGMENVCEQVEITRAAYRLFGDESRLNHHIFEGGHCWNGEKTFEFLQKWLEG